MLNLRGLSESKRRLFDSVVQSILLYSAPSWTGSLEGNARNSRTLAGVQRRVAIRCTAAYRSVSYDAATLVARTPPIDLFIKKRLEVYLARRRVPTGVGGLLAEVYTQLKNGSIHYCIPSQYFSDLFNRRIALVEATFKPA